LRSIRTNTPLSHIAKTTGYLDLRNIAVSRLMLDNFEHIKAYWIMLTPSIAQIALRFGGKRSRWHSRRRKDLPRCWSENVRVHATEPKLETPDFAPRAGSRSSATLCIAPLSARKWRQLLRDPARARFAHSERLICLATLYKRKNSRCHSVEGPNISLLY